MELCETLTPLRGKEILPINSNARLVILSLSNLNHENLFFMNNSELWFSRIISSPCILSSQPAMPVLFSDTVDGGFLFPAEMIIFVCWKIKLLWYFVLLIAWGFCFKPCRLKFKLKKNKALTTGAPRIKFGESKPCTISIRKMAVFFHFLMLFNYLPRFLLLA